MSKNPHILTIIGARPQFIKHAALMYEYRLNFADKFKLTTLHTGQHYDKELNDIFFEELNISTPDIQLMVGSKSHPTQIAEMMLGIEASVKTLQPDYILVYGDTNSTLAGGVVAAKMNIPLIHVEAGLRSGQMDMPEEVNRIITDRISNILLCPSTDAVYNLTREGILNSVEVGDIMKDMIRYIPSHEQLAFEQEYIYATIHRPTNTDHKERLISILEQLNSLPFTVVFSLHPRTKSRMIAYKLSNDKYENINFITPVGYFQNMSYLHNAQFLITDSGGMQKEAYWCKTACITVRPSTEWTETLAGKWNQLVEPMDISNAIEIKPHNAAYQIELYGDGDTAQKILDVILNHYKDAE